MSRTTLNLIALPERCYRCGGLTRGIVGVLVPGPHGRDIFREFDDVAHALSAVLDDATLARCSIGPIKERRSRQRGAYVSNGCVHCGAILGSFPLREGFLTYVVAGGDVRKLVVRIALTVPNDRDWITARP